MIPHLKSTKIPGFTLVEVAIALGIFAFSIVPIIGLMNVALNVNKDSVDTFALSQVVRKAGTQIATSGTFYFLNTGEEDVSSEHTNAVYQATLTETTGADAAAGLLARKVLSIEVFRANTSHSIYKRTLQLSQDPVDLQAYF